MNSLDNIPAAFNRFTAVARRFCNIVDSSADLDRASLLVHIYGVLPELIQEAINLPAVGSGDDEVPGRDQTRLGQPEWSSLYQALKKRLANWDVYMDVFDPTKDTEAIHGSLADDIADIYRDLKEGLDDPAPTLATQHNIIWEWRLGYYSHWGQHAMGALRTIHWLMANEP
jgi:hypothetical protein